MDKAKARYFENSLFNHFQYRRGLARSVILCSAQESQFTVHFEIIVFLMYLRAIGMCQL